MKWNAFPIVGHVELAILAAILAWLSASPASAQETVIRVGHFPNITHVQGVLAHSMTRQGKGWFEQRLGPNVKIDWYTYNAGPSAMEAIFAGSIDLTYVGASPALNAYVRSRGREIRIVAGAANGGAALVIQSGSNLKTAADFRGKKIGTPQLGNTQDVSARGWLSAGGLKITMTGGDAQVVPTANPDQLTLFMQKQLDAVWTVEPWVARLELEADGKVLIEETDAITTVLVSSVKFLGAKRELVRKFVNAHLELTEWIKLHPQEAQNILREEITAETHTSLAPELIARAWQRLILTGEISREPLEKHVAYAQRAGFLRDAPDLAPLVEKP